MKRKRALDTADLHTERGNPASADLDTKSSLDIAAIINREDQKVAKAVRKALPEIAKAIGLVEDALRCGGRLIYVGTGTSGRIGALDASECSPTFNSPPGRVQFVIAGGEEALSQPVEDEEDSHEAGRADIAKKKPGKKDVVVGLAASGRTPYTVAALEYAKSKGSKTIAVVCNFGSPLAKAAHLAIEVEVGPEVITGSTRMKAGTAQKMICNMITTGAFTRLGYVYGNLMVNLHLKNRKLVDRGIRIVRQVSGVSDEEAVHVLAKAGENVPVALVMLKGKLTKPEAIRRLRAAGGSVRKAISGLR